MSVDLRLDLGEPVETFEVIVSRSRQDYELWLRFESRILEWPLHMQACEKRQFQISERSTRQPEQMTEQIAILVMIVSRS